MLMKHDINGLKDATGFEIEAMKKNGWYEYGYENFYADVAKKKQTMDNAVQPESVTDGNHAEPSGDSPKKRGRKPKGV